MNRSIGLVKGSLREEDRSEVSQAIRRFRLRSGMTQDNLGKATGISPAMIGILECQSKMTAMHLNIAYLNRFKDVGCDLSEIHNLTIDYKKVKHFNKTPDLSIKFKGAELSDSFRKAMALVLDAKTKYEERINTIDKDILAFETQAESLLAQAEILKTKKQAILGKIHKADLSIDNIKASIMDEAD